MKRQNCRVFLDGDTVAITVPGTHHQISATPGGHSCYGDIQWLFFATLSGVAIQIWDEVQRSLPSEECSTYFSSGFAQALEDGAELFAACIAAQIPLDSTDETSVKAALSAVSFTVVDYDKPIYFERHTRSRPFKIRQHTQKILDGGEDMTV